MYTYYSSPKKSPKVSQQTESPFTPKKKFGFLTQHPSKIDVDELYDGGFMLSEYDRKHVSEALDLRQDRNIMIQTEASIKEIYLIGQQAFVLGPYLGSGAFGDVFIVQNVFNATWHCMKLARHGSLEEIELDALKQEGLYRASSKISNTDLLVTELVNGKTLHALITRNRKMRETEKKLSFEKILGLTISIIEAYESLHRKGYVHRDIKPDNIMVDLAQKKCVAIDFGLIAKSGQSIVKGAALYMPIELYDRKSAMIEDDIYSMGVTISELLSSGYQYDPVLYQEILSRTESLQVRSNYQSEREYRKLWNQDTIIFHVMLGSESTEYRELNQLSREEIQLCQLLYHMIGPESDRPDLKTILDQTKSLRLAQIEIGHNRLVDDYAGMYQTLVAMREDLKIRSLDALDQLDIFLLRMVDRTETNRPTLEEVIKYHDTLQTVFDSKRDSFLKEIQEFKR